MRSRQVLTCQPERCLSVSDPFFFPVSVWTDKKAEPAEIRPGCAAFLFPVVAIAVCGIEPFFTRVS